MKENAGKRILGCAGRPLHHVYVLSRPRLPSPTHRVDDVGHVVSSQSDLAMVAGVVLQQSSGGDVARLLDD